MTYTLKSLALAAAATALLSACVSMSAVPANQPFKAETAFEVTPSESWTRLPNGLNPTRGSALTQDGTPLGAVYMVTVKNDKAMVDTAGGSANLPRYTTGSTPLEQIDFLTASLELIGFSNVETSDVRSEPVDGKTGTRMGLNGKYANGLNMKGDAVLVESDEGLNVLVYTAAEMVYYEKYRQAAETLMASIDLE
ncbi:hypothetical protein [Litorimonas sp. WD9-15]|uniref:hypothetical protein n=1 Tax=Litorimonas sp. WD9-15 TaxID=3418716 RepID=UPI003D046937